MVEGKEEEEQSTGMYIWCNAVEMDALRQLLLLLLLLIDRDSRSHGQTKNE